VPDTLRQRIAYLIEAEQTERAGEDRDGTPS